MNKSMQNWIIGFLVLITLAYFIDTEPPPKTDQDIFNDQVEALQNEYEEALDSENSIFVEKIEAKAKQILRKNWLFKDWSAEILSISNGSVNNAIEKSYTIIAENNSTTFHLNVNNSFKPQIENMKKGDKITFSGQAAKEESITISGAIDNPEFKFYPTKLSVLTKDINITQTAKPKESAKKEKINDPLKAAREQIKDRYLSDEEPTAKDAVWTMHDIFKVAVINNGSSMNGYAEYVCLTLYDYGFKGQAVWVQIVDIGKVVNDKKFVKIGEAHCS